MPRLLQMLSDTSIRDTGGAPVAWLAATAGLTALALALALPTQVFDTNFYSLWEATSLLAGDRLYRDLYEWGIPLQAALSALSQWLVGYRMVGEFVLLHWTSIIAGAVISFDLGYRISRSATASFALALLALQVLPDTPTFHYPKLVFYPLAIWLCWRYMDGPTPGRAAALGLTTAVAFLFRHDHGVYIAGAAFLAFVLARFTVAARPTRASVRDAAAYAIAAAILLVPWAVLVQTREGLPEYVRSRSDLYRMWSADTPYRSFLTTNPVRLWRGTPPAPTPGALRFAWSNGASDARRHELEARFDLKNAEGPDPDGVWRYHVDNVFDPALFGLRDLVHNTEGLDWSRLEELNSWTPAREPARMLRAQITLLVPFLLLGSAALAFVRAWRGGVPAPPYAYRFVLAGVFLAVVNGRLLREPSYSHLVAPLTAALCVRFLALAPKETAPKETAAGHGHTSAGGAFARVRVAATVVIMLITAAVGWACMQPARPLTPDRFAEVAANVAELFVSPPIDAFVTEHDVQQLTQGHDRDAWEGGKVSGWPEILLRYIHDCTREGDHVLVSGSTPYHIGYLLERPIAGGQLFWHHRWRSDAAREGQTLALLESQSVPFAFSTHDPLLDDLKPYPRIRDHFLANYAVLPGSRGLLLVDNRKKPTGEFGPFGFPCFK